MCLPNFVEFKQIDESSPVIGYRNWRKKIESNNLILISENQNYNWSKLEGPHEVKLNNSGIYSYNYYNYYDNYNNYNYYYNNYYNYYNYNYNNYNNYNYYYITGVIKQWGKVAIHKVGYRSEFAKIDTIFSIRRSDAKGSKEFLDWIDKFNEITDKLAIEYECKVISWQNFVEGQKNK